VERRDELAGSATLCRLDNRAERATAVAISKVFVEQFIGSFKKTPQELVLDFDV